MSSLAYFSDVVVASLKFNREMAFTESAQLPWSPGDKNCGRFLFRGTDALLNQFSYNSDLLICNINSSLQFLLFQFNMHEAPDA